MNTRRSFFATCLTAGAASQLPNLTEPTSELMDDSNCNYAPPSKQEKFVSLAAGFAHEILKRRSEERNYLRAMGRASFPSTDEYIAPVDPQVCASHACAMAKLILAEADKL